MTNRSVLLATLSVTIACAPSYAPTPETVSRVTSPGSGRVEIHNALSMVGRNVPAPMDSVWKVLPRVYEILGITEAAGDENGTTFGMIDFRPKRIEGKRLSTYIDCGMGATAVPKADTYEITMSLLTRLSATDDGHTRVETTVEASGKPRAVTGNPIYCQSNGVLESRVADLVLWVLVSGR